MNFITYHANPHTKAHLYLGDTFALFCGRYIGDYAEVESSDSRARGDGLCRTCRRAAGARDIAPFNQEATSDRTLKGQQIRVSGAVRPISAKVYRVAGSSDTYTVTVPLESGLPVSCTCMDAKVNPDKFCKHASAVLLEMQVRGGEAA